MLVSIIIIKLIIYNYT